MAFDKMSLIRLSGRQGIPQAMIELPTPKGVGFFE